jgi:hypothetical protein
MLHSWDLLAGRGGRQGPDAEASVNHRFADQSRRHFERKDLLMTMAALPVDTSRVADVLALHQLKARYFRLLDTKQWDEMRTLFTPDMLFFHDRTMFPSSTEPASRSADEFIANVSALLASSVTVHHGHSPEIELTGDWTATGIWAMFDHVEGTNDGRTFEGYGHYHERYEKGEDGRWRIKELRLTRLRYVPAPESSDYQRG